MKDRDTQRKLVLLRSKGYRFLRTDDDGNTWIGTHDAGLPLERLIHNACFQGDIVVESPVCGVTTPS